MTMPNLTSELSESSLLKPTVAKANEAIAIRPKRGKLTLLTRRIYNAMLFHAQQQGVEQTKYTVPLAVLITDAHFSSNNTQVFKGHIREMQTTLIEWHDSIGEGRKWTSCQLLGTVTIEEGIRGRPCVITWTYPDAVKEWLLKPQHYTRLLLEVSARVRSHATAVLYELGSRYLTSPGRLTMRNGVAWWAAVLTGRSDVEGIDYRILKRDTLTKALAELEVVSDEFFMELIEHRRGRGVEEFQFRVIPKKSPTTNLLPAPLDLGLLDRLMAVGIKQRDAQEILASGLDQEIIGVLTHIEQRIANGSPVRSAAAYMRDALKRGYIRPARQSEQLSMPPAAAHTSTAGLRQDLAESWSRHQATRARSAYEALNEARQAGHREAFGQTLSGVVARKWQQEGPKGKLAATLFFAWLARQLWPDPPTDSELLQHSLDQSALAAAGPGRRMH
jgi:hypothetical protein